MCLILNLVYLVSQASRPATAIQVKTLFRINCRFSFQNSVSFSRSLCPGDLGLSGKISYHFRLPLSGALLYYHTAHPHVNTFFAIFFAFFRLFFSSETSAFPPLGMFGFKSRCCVFSLSVPQISVFLPLTHFAEYKKKTVSGWKQ